MKRLGDIAYARSGDKGDEANIGVIALSKADYSYLEQVLTADAVGQFLAPLGGTEIVRYELPNLLAFNFVCKGILAGGASRSLRLDSQGKTLGQALLEMPLKG